MEDDLQLKEEVMAKLKEHPKLDTTHLTVVIKEAILTLEGRADTQEEKELAESIARAYPGIKEVKNHLHVGSGIIHAITSIVSGLSASNDDDLHKKK